MSNAWTVWCRFWLGVELNTELLILLFTKRLNILSSQFFIPRDLSHLPVCIDHPVPTQLCTFLCVNTHFLFSFALTCNNRPGTNCVVYFLQWIMSTPLGGGYIIFAFFAVRCPMSVVRCPMSGVRHPMSGVTHGFRSFKGKVLELLSPNLVCRLIGSVACLGLLLAVVPLLLTE